MISALFLIMEIHSITNLKAYEQAKNVFNPANIESSSEESFSEKRKIFIGMPSLFTWVNCKSWTYVIDDKCLFKTLSQKFNG